MSVEKCDANDQSVDDERERDIIDVIRFESEEKQPVVTPENRFFYRKINGTTYRLGLELTEDQRQLMTGDGTDNRLGVDDCETLASAHNIMEHTMKGAHESMRDKGVVHEVIDAKNNGTFKTLAEERMLPATNNFVEHHNLGKAFSTDFPRSELIGLVGVMAIVMNRFRYNYKLVIGDASTASNDSPKVVGEKEKDRGNKTNVFKKLAGE